MDCLGVTSDEKGDADVSVNGFIHIRNTPQWLVLADRLWLPIVGFGVYSLLFFLSVAHLQPDASIFPMALIAAIGVLLVTVIVGEVRALISDSKQGSLLGGTAPRAFDRKSFSRKTSTIGVFILYLFAIPRVGFVIATGLFIAILTGILMGSIGRRPIAICVVVAVSGAVGSYFLFEVFFGVALPRGAWM